MTLISMIGSILASALSLFTNPILHSDYSDPDLICVDGEYWMVSSSFSYSLDSRKFKVLGEDFEMKAGKCIGAKVGFFATAKIKKNDGGSVDIY